MQGLKDHMRAFADHFMSQDFTHIKDVDKFSPSKMTKGKLGYPWIDARIRARINVH